MASVSGTDMARAFLAFAEACEGYSAQSAPNQAVLVLLCDALHLMGDIVLTTQCLLPAERAPVMEAFAPQESSEVLCQSPGLPGAIGNDGT